MHVGETGRRGGIQSCRIEEHVRGRAPGQRLPVLRHVEVRHADIHEDHTDTLNGDRCPEVTIHSSRLRFG